LVSRDSLPRICRIAKRMRGMMGWASYVGSEVVSV
jgi:hypothetical protein